ncbi:MAG: hypothetical protein HY279_02525 [Nitrospinae bacterium]|nr:hypothetical protein [Nitrospinota bacterium]
MKKITIILFFLGFVLPAGAITPKAKAGEFMEEKCKVILHIRRGESPWIDYTKSFEEEQAGEHISAVHIETSFDQPAYLSRYTLSDGPLLTINRAARRVVVNNNYFSDLDRPDATNLTKGKSLVIGTFKGLSVAGISAQHLVFFLLESQIIKTYVHLESKLCLVSEEDGKTSYTANFEGAHIYYTNMRNEQPFSFTVRINKKTGLMEISRYY